MSLLLPSLMRVRIARSARPGPGIWLPVFVFWPLWLLVLLLFMVGLVVATAAVGSSNYRGAFAATRELHRLVSGLRGAQCEIQGNGKHLSFAFI
ncbi:MAG TPA: hypothetical protein VJV78_26335 [Polyangiales bacterium]|nr:hypothetical protein [Polyangiales bacterium]